MNKEELKIIKQLIKKEESKNSVPKTDSELIKDILERVKRLEERDNGMTTLPYIPWSPMDNIYPTYSTFNTKC